MTATTVEHQQDPEDRQWDCLLHTWQELHLPEGWRAGIDDGRIVLVPPPHARHHGIAAKVQRHLHANLPDELGICQTLGVHVTPLDKLYVPDLAVMPSELIDAADPDTSDPVDASEALLVVEITSKGNAREDRTKKYRAYARAGVPMYLLIDRFDTRGTMSTLFTEPNEDGTYKRSDPVPFGKPLGLPAPSASPCPRTVFRSEADRRAAAPPRGAAALLCRGPSGQTAAGSFAGASGPPVVVAGEAAATGEAIGSWETLNSASRSLPKPKKYVARKPVR